MRFVTEPESKKVRVSAIFNEEDYTVNSSTNYDLDFVSGFDVDAGTILYVNILNMYGEAFYVSVTANGETAVFAA